MDSQILPFLKPDINIKDAGDYMECPFEVQTEGLKANMYYFSNPLWAEEYLTYCHRDDHFISRWSVAVGDWKDKIVLDIGCGPGNILASLKEPPKLIIGVDVAKGSLLFAKKQGYTTLLADASNLPFISDFADIVIMNASLHHCENMEVVLKEAARIVKPGGKIITDHDPQLSAWNYKGVAKILWNARLYIYKYLKKGFHKSDSQQYWALASEIHHKPGHGVTTEFFEKTLTPLGYEVEVFPHNHTLGAEIFEGKKGKADLKYRIGNFLSGRNPNASKSAITLMCIAKKNKG